MQVISRFFRLISQASTKAVQKNTIHPNQLYLKIRQVFLLSCDSR